MVRSGGIALAATLIFGSPAYADWRRAESDNFIVYAEMSESSIREYVTELERFDRLLRHFSNLEAESVPIKLRVFVVRDVQHVADYAGDEDTAGFYQGSLRGPFAVVPRRNTNFGPFQVKRQEVLFHEYSHHFMLHYFPAAYPAWYLEGYAEMYSTVRFRSDNRVDLGRSADDRTNQIFLYGRMGMWMPMEYLLSNEYPNNAMTYAEGWLLVHRAVFDPRAGRELADYLNAINGGESGREAYERIFADREPPLDEDLIEYISDNRLPYAPLEIDLGEVREPEVTEISDDQADVILLRARDPQSFLEEAEEIVAEQPRNPMAHAEHARALIAQGRYQDAVAAADRALTNAPDHVDAHLFKAEALRGLGEAADDPQSPYWQQARTEALAANRADPDSALALFEYFLSWPEDMEQPANALPALERAFALVPQNDRVRLQLGKEYLALERFSEARRVVSAVAESAHGSPQQGLAIVIAELGDRELGFEHAETVVAELNAERERLRAEAQNAEPEGDAELEAPADGQPELVEAEAEDEMEVETLESEADPEQP